jgi:pimeloyl-ACP methyl ester carboxylesterase
MSMSDFVLPATRYALSGDVNIAYQVMGEGPIDIVIVPGMISHVEFAHEMTGYTAFLRRLSTFARVVTFDKRGQGLSDRVSGAPALEQRMDDVRAIMDDIGSKRATLFGFSEGGPMSILFAATYPERVSKLILFGTFAVSGGFTAPDAIERLVKVWGAGVMIKSALPSQAENPEAVALLAKFERLSTSPGALRSLMQMNALIDVRSILPTVRVPRSCFIVERMRWFRSNKAENWRRKFLTRDISNILPAIISSFPAIRTPSLATSRNL